MGIHPIAERIVEIFETLPEQLQKAARFVIDNPDDVALLSMREQARRAGVQPWTMVRLAQRLGFSGYDEIRALHANAVRQGTAGFVSRASVQVEAQQAQGDAALAAEIIASTAAQISRLAEPASIAALTRAAERLDAAHRVFCLGLRSSHAVAAQFAYVMSLLGEKTVLLDCRAGSGMDGLRLAGPDDVLLVVSVAPYTAATVEAALSARARNVPIVAITDSPVAPLAGMASALVIATTESPSFFHAMSPAFLVGEVLAALVAGRGGDASLAALRETERQLVEFGVHWRQPAQRKRS